MCDYSLHTVKSRAAQVADRLVTTRFSNAITRGFSAVGQPEVAVCLRPGTEIVFEHNIEYENFIGVLPNRKTEWNTARFRQIRPEEPHVHHDALELPDGQIVLLTKLCEGQHATVLQLPADTTAKVREAEEHEKDVFSV